MSATPDTTPLDPPVHNPPTSSSGSAGSAIGERVQLYAFIRRSSEYHLQYRGKEPFPVTLKAHPFDAYVVLGNGNQYRFADLRFYVRVDGRFVALS